MHHKRRKIFMSADCRREKNNSEVQITFIKDINNQDVSNLRT